MKRIPTFSLATLIILLCTVTVESQTIRIVDNNNTAPPADNVIIFTSLQTAINTADPGDIIQIKGSPTSYGNATVDKQLTIQGVGFNLTKEFPELSIVGDLTLSNSSITESSGSLITGLQINSLFIGFQGASSYTCSNITVENCDINWVYQGTSSSYVNIDGLEIKYCYIAGGTTYDLQFQHFIDNSTIRNNVIVGNISYESSLTMTNNNFHNNIIYGTMWVEAVNTNTFLINHNNFMGDASGDFAFNYRFRYNSVQNNIFYGRSPAMQSANNFEGNLFGHNLSYGGVSNDYQLPPAGVGGPNQDDPGNNIPNEQPQFVSTVPFSNSWNSSLDFSLQVTSMGSGASSTGDDIGVTGGPTPFATGNLVLRPTGIPTIESLTTTGVVNPGDNLNVKVKVKGN